MHFIPDTEDEDSAAETFWPEAYKQVIREDLRQAVGAQLTRRKPFRRVYRQGYKERYATYEQFLDKIADMVTVGAENGADDAFDEIVDAFMAEEALPDPRCYAGYSWPQGLPRPVRDRLRQAVIDEYARDDVYTFAYNVGYRNDYGTFDGYIDRVAELVVVGTMNGANDMLETLYRSFLYRERLAPARRHPRRLKMF